MDPLVWSLFGVMVGLTATVPSVVMQLMSTMLLVNMVWAGTPAPTNDIAGAAILILFFIGIQDIAGLISIVSHLICPPRDAPPWLTRAPYVPHGGTYGDSMFQYRVKPKSGPA